MFSQNVFRNLPLTVSLREEEIDEESMWEFRQLNSVYKVFVAFLNLAGFDEEKLEPFVDKTFVNALIQRLNSCMEAERDWVKQILIRLFDKAHYSRLYILRGTVNSLIASGHLSNNGGIKELLELFKIFMCYKLVDSSVITKVTFLA